ncbi:MAG: glycosyltransferase family 25 protein [Acetobacter papayae]|uniref:glycosyltransferase family 25 protein n=1 Tax=Acetobacter papayae TaxID=1076592 RepID=UPI0039E85856
MDKFFISLDSAPERSETFQRLNAHVPDILPFKGLDASTVDLPAMQQAGLVSKNCTFSPADLASALNHVSLWGTVMRSGTSAYVFDDRAVLCRNFSEVSQDIIEKLPTNWDIVCWNWAGDNVMQYELLPGVTHATITYFQDSVQKHIKDFNTTGIASLPFRLVQMFGFGNYAISPSGAAKLIKSCLPLNSEEVLHYCLGGQMLQATDLSILLNRYYMDIAAFITVPPLCLSDLSAPV